MRREEVAILDISVLTNSPASSMLPCTTPTAVFFSAERREGGRGKEREGRKEEEERGVLMGRMRMGKMGKEKLVLAINSHTHVVNTCTHFQ